MAEKLERKTAFNRLPLGSRGVGFDALHTALQAFHKSATDAQFEEFENFFFPHFLACDFTWADLFEVLKKGIGDTNDVDVNVALEFIHNIFVQTERHHK